MDSEAGGTKINKGPPSMAPQSMGPPPMGVPTQMDPQMQQMIQQQMAQEQLAQQHLAQQQMAQRQMGQMGQQQMGQMGQQQMGQMGQQVLPPSILKKSSYGKSSFSFESAGVKNAALVAVIFLLLNSKMIWKQIIQLPFMGRVEPSIIALVVNSILAGMAFYLLSNFLNKK